MAASRRKTKKEEEAVATEEKETSVPPVEQTQSVPTLENEVEKRKEPKYKIGSIVFVSKDVEADLNGFKLFPPYKNYTYTVEAYNSNTDVYSLRNLNLLLSLKGADIVAPHEKEDSSLFRKQF